MPAPGCSARSRNPIRKFHNVEEGIVAANGGFVPGSNALLRRVMGKPKRKFYEKLIRSETSAFSLCASKSTEQFRQLTNLG